MTRTRRRARHRRLRFRLHSDEAKRRKKTAKYKNGSSERGHDSSGNGRGGISPMTPAQQHPARESVEIRVYVCVFPPRLVHSVHHH